MCRRFCCREPVPAGKRSREYRYRQQQLCDGDGAPAVDAQRRKHALRAATRSLGLRDTAKFWHWRGGASENGASPGIRTGTTQRCSAERTAREFRCMLAPFISQISQQKKLAKRRAKNKIENALPATDPEQLVIAPSSQSCHLITLSAPAIQGEALSAMARKPGEAKGSRLNSTIKHLLIGSRDLLVGWRMTNEHMTASADTEDEQRHRASVTINGPARRSKDGKENAVSTSTTTCTTMAWTSRSSQGSRAVAEHLFQIAPIAVIWRGPHDAADQSGGKRLVSGKNRASPCSRKGDVQGTVTGNR